MPKLPAIPCTKPWTSLEERHILGEYKVCCWAKCLIGVCKKDFDHDFISLWNSRSLQNIRKSMVKDHTAICPPSCPVLNDRKNQFNKVELFDYDDIEYNQFDPKFVNNRNKVLAAISERSIVTDTYPTRLKLHPSNKCNFNCRMCNLDRSYSYPPSKKYIENIYSLLPYLENLEIFGGEPLCCKTTRSLILNDVLENTPMFTFQQSQMALCSMVKC